MKDTPVILSVDRIDNSVIVEFEGDKDPTVYPADFLHAARGVATLMAERNVSETKRDADDTIPKVATSLFLVPDQDKSEE